MGWQDAPVVDDASDDAAPKWKSAPAADQDAQDALQEGRRGGSAKELPDKVETVTRGNLGGAGAQASDLTYQTPQGRGWQDVTKDLQALEKRAADEGKKPQDYPEYAGLIKERATSLQRAGEGGLESAAAGAAGGAAGKVIGAVAKPIAGIASRAFSKAPALAEKEATSAAEALRQKALTETDTGVAAKEKEALTARERAQGQAQAVEKTAGAQAQGAEDAARGAAQDPAKRAEAATKAQQEIKARQAVVAAERAKAQAVEADTVRQKVLAETRERVRVAEKNQKEAGATTQQAQDLALEQEARLKAAHDGADKLDAQLAARPGMDKETFGQQIRSVAQSMSDRLKAYRAREAKYGETLAAAGDTPRVDTTDIDAYIDTASEASRNPSTRRALAELKNLLTTTSKQGDKEVADNKLTLAQADDLRKTISSWVENKVATTKEGANFAVDAATAAALKPIKKDLTRAAIQAWPDYGKALERHATLSRPLNVLQRNAGIGKILDRNPATTEYKRDLADVVGEVLKKANKGNKALDALVADSPEIKESARLYFSRELFDQGVPTQARLGTFLKTNESALRKLGLYDEFKSIKAARAAAKQAVDDATDAHGLSLKEAKAAAEREREAARKVKVAEHLRDTAKKRAEENPNAAVVERNTVRGGDKSPVKKESVEQAQRRLEKVERDNRAKAESLREKGAAEATKIREKSAAESEAIRRGGEVKAGEALNTKKDYQIFGSQIKSAPIEDVASKADSMADSLVKKGLLTKTQYENYLKQVGEVRDKFSASQQAAADQKAARARLKHIALGALAVANLWEFRRAIMDWTR